MLLHDDDIANPYPPRPHPRSFSAGSGLFLPPTHAHSLFLPSFLSPPSPVRVSWSEDYPQTNLYHVRHTVRACTARRAGKSFRPPSASNCRAGVSSHNPNLGGTWGPTIIGSPSLRLLACITPCHSESYGNFVLPADHSDIYTSYDHFKSA